MAFIEEITTRGEWSLVFIEGVLTHAMVKHPGAGDFRVQAHYGGSSARAQASPALERAGLRALEALPVSPLYARVDGVETGDGFLVMEVEVHEPGLFFPRRRKPPGPSPRRSSAVSEPGTGAIGFASLHSALASQPSR